MARHFDSKHWGLRINNKKHISVHSARTDSTTNPRDNLALVVESSERTQPYCLIVQPYQITPISHNIMTICLSLSRSPFFCQNSPDPLRLWLPPNVCCDFWHQYISGRSFKTLKHPTSPDSEPSFQSVSWCHVFPLVSDAHRPGHPHDVNGNMIDKKRPPSSLALWQPDQSAATQLCMQQTAIHCVLLTAFYQSQNYFFFFFLKINFYRTLQASLCSQHASISP